MAKFKKIQKFLMRPFDLADERMNSARRKKRNAEFTKFMNDILNPKSKINNKKLKKINFS